MVLSLLGSFTKSKEKLIPLLTENELIKIKSLIMKKSDQPLAILPDERKIIEGIKTETSRKNKNNCTRTKAYLDYFQRNKEIEWSFLAHMVSRNAGYHMTDLKADFLPSLLQEREARNFYLFLEKANASIFHDAFPQLLLYRKSVEKKTPLFHLLPAFGVSRAMAVFWERFWMSGDKTEMTLALIINEQSMLQRRVISKIKEKHLYEKLLFLIQDRMELTTVFFPYRKRNKSKKPYSLAGTSISHFENAQNRINIGKKLYAILLMKKNIYHSSFEFASITPHTGSRSDYWPESYSLNKMNGQKVFSPPLTAVLDDLEQTYSHEDWVHQNTIQNVDALNSIFIPKHFDVSLQARILIKMAAEWIPT
jgi:hypothetical protein